MENKNFELKVMTIAADVLAKEFNETAAKLRAQREEHEKTYCIECGRRIDDWFETEQTNDELILSYTCPCGCIAEQHYKLTYTCTEVLQEARDESQIR